MSTTSVPQDVSRAWYRQCHGHPDPAKAVLAALAAHDDTTLLRHYLLSLRNTRPDLAALASDRRRYDAICNVYARRYRPAQTGSHASPSSPAGGAVGGAVASMNSANVRLVRRLVGALFTSDPERTLKPRAATLLTVSVLDQAGDNTRLGRDWTGLWLGASDCALKTGCGRAAATADLHALAEAGALRPVTTPRAGVVTRYRQGRLAGPASAAADALRPVTAALVDGAVEPGLAEVLGSAGHLIWSWTPHGHDALWVLAGDAYGELTGLGAGGPGAGLSAVRKRRARRWLDARGLTFGSWSPGELRDALDAAVTVEARQAMGRAVEARAEQVATRRAAVAEAQAARASVGGLLAVVGSVPAGGPGADAATASGWMAATRAARSWGTTAERTDLRRRLRRRGWGDPAGAALHLLPGVVDALVAVAGPIPSGDADEDVRRAWLTGVRGAGVCGEPAREELAAALTKAGWVDGVAKGSAFAIPAVETAQAG